ncbi:heat- and acid-stable phosphoprotein [Rhizophlyctis rosea]|nr:heat- and acid-stable phosphoprotein [Rhizophlyctis rosea]
MPGPSKGKLNKTKRGGGKRFTPTRVLRGQDGDEPEGMWAEPREKASDEESSEAPESSEEESEDESPAQSSQQSQPRGPLQTDDAHNPNRAANKHLKASDLAGGNNGADGGDRELSRREREALEKERAKAAFWKAQMEGKTEQARADLARLAIIKKQREEAAKKKAEEAAAKHQASASKSESLNAGKGIISKSLGKKK